MVPPCSFGATAPEVLHLILGTLLTLAGVQRRAVRACLGTELSSLADSTLWWARVQTLRYLRGVRPKRGRSLLQTQCKLGGRGWNGEELVSRVAERYWPAKEPPQGNGGSPLVLDG